MIKKHIGTLIPLSALRSENNVNARHGTFEEGMIFLDWLAKTKQSIWQLLPLHETQLIANSTEHVPSPYQGYGVGIDPKYHARESGNTHTDFDEKLFLKQNEKWLFAYALFCALRDHFSTDEWTTWPESIRTRRKEDIDLWQKKLEKKVDAYIHEQIQLHRQYFLLKTKAKSLGIKIIGDIPFYLSIKSPLVWMYQNLFAINPDGTMDFVSGLPKEPHDFHGRQVWGHPLYNWESCKEQIVTLWKLRLDYLSQLFDTVRLDHANGFFHYGAVSTDPKRKDVMKYGPGISIIEELVLYARKISLELYAEDAATDVKELQIEMKKLAIPGIRIFRYGFNEKDTMLYESTDIKNYPKNFFAYTTTHDTEPLMLFLDKLSGEHKKILCKSAKIPFHKDNRILAKTIRDAVINSPAQTVIIQMQDWLLTKERINVPGTEKEQNDPNWQYRLPIPIEKLPQAIAEK